MVKDALTERPMARSLGPALARLGDWRRYVIYIAFVAIFVFFAATLGPYGFLSATNLLNILRQTATTTIMAVAVTFVIAAAEIDLSIGSTVGLASVTTALAIQAWGLPVGVAAGLLTGLAVGLVNGALVATLTIPSFLVTLGTTGIAQGAAIWISNSAPVPILSDAYNGFFGGGNVGPVPSLVVWTALVVAIGAIALDKTAYGRRVLATGGNRVAAEYSGVDTKRIKFTVLLVSGLVAGLGGMLYAGRLQSGRFEWGTGDELSVIAAVILGGTSLFGGSATVLGAVFGSLMIGLINNGLLLAGLESSQQIIVRGVVIILAVALARRK